MAVGATGDQTLTTRRTTAQAGHIRLGGRLVDEDKPGRGEASLFLLPLLPGLCDVGAALLGGMQRLFLKVSPMETNA